MVVEKQMEIAEVNSADVPVEVLGLQVHAENIRQQGIEGLRDVRYHLSVEVGRRVEGSISTSDQLCFGGHNRFRSRFNCEWTWHSSFKLHSEYWSKWMQRSSRNTLRPAHSHFYRFTGRL